MEYRLTRNWGTWGDVAWGTYAEMLARYNATFQKAGRIPDMCLSRGDTILRSIKAEYVNPKGFLAFFQD